MTVLKLKYYIGFGILLKVGGLVFFSHFEDSSNLVALIYAFVLVCFLAFRPLKKFNSTL